MTPSDRERLCICLSFPPNHAPDCPRSSRERLREQFGDVDTCTGCGREEADCTCRSTGQAEEETSDGLQSGFSVGDVHRGSNNSDRDVARKPNLETGREVRNVVAAAPLTSHSVSAPDHAALREMAFVVDYLNKKWPVVLLEDAIKYASSSNAATEKILADARLIADGEKLWKGVKWVDMCKRAETAEAERDSLREALRDLLEWSPLIPSEKMHDTIQRARAALGDPPEKGTV